MFGFVSRLMRRPEHRYRCTHPTCIQNGGSKHFRTWTQLQAHTRETHPPTCPYPSCKGKTFTQQKGLRSHLKIHEQREIEDQLKASAGFDADDEGEGATKRRRGGEIGRDWQCTEPNCDKAFKSVGRNCLYSSPAFVDISSQRKRL